MRGKTYAQTQILALLLGIFAAQLLLTTSVKANQTWTKTNLTDRRIRVVENSPWGILAGEYNQLIWKNPYNGILITRDFGDTWEEIGLERRGVTDIKHYDKKIYATTYYYDEGTVGLFRSDDTGNAWQQISGNFSTSTVSVDLNSILLGTYSHGLWHSTNDGITWEQKIGDGFYGPRIYETKIAENIMLAAGETTTFISKDNGITWTPINALEGLRIRNLEVVDEMILAGTDNDMGLYKSIDLGETWSKVTLWGDQPVGGITSYRNTFYAGRKNLELNKFDVYKSLDFGETWSPTEIPQIYNEGITPSITWAFSIPSYIFAVVPIEGVYRYQVAQPKSYETPFLEIPWEVTNTTDLIEDITSFFDHEYPFSDYPHFREPLDHTNTTINYLGIEEAEPILFYTGHDGYDFKLDFGTPITASHEGYATYKYEPEGRGHHIIVSHQNGYETTYAHLQETDLITTQGPVWIETGQQIGLIGMSGNTTGPHLHFAVKKLFENEPEQNVDPFGWKNLLQRDPWNGFKWIDSQGEHTGTKSNYLWKVDPTTKGLSNKEVIIEENSTEHNFTIFIEPYPQPKTPITQNKLTYVKGTSMIVNLYNILGQELPPLFEPAKIEIDISNVDTENILDNTLKIYYWDENQNLWIPIPSFYDALSLTIYGYTRHFSQFAVFGINNNAWKQTINIHTTYISIGNFQT
jgi:murein DD-endopeptidase MepM/ murein hydrolase activator NlpD